jgi:hypothetical protein
MEFGVFIKHYILTDQEFILRQLLRLCALQDFSDEVGKRAIWDLMSSSFSRFCVKWIIDW